MLLYVSSEYVCMSTRSIDRLYGALLTRRIEFVWRTSCNDSWNGKRISYTQLNAQLWQGRLSSGHLSKQTIFVCIYMMRTFSLFFVQRYLYEFSYPHIDAGSEDAVKFKPVPSELAINNMGREFHSILSINDGEPRRFAVKTRRLNTHSFRCRLRVRWISRASFLSNMRGHRKRASVTWPIMAHVCLSSKDSKVTPIRRNHQCDYYDRRLPSPGGNYALL